MQVILARGGNTVCAVQCVDGAQEIIVIGWMSEPKNGVDAPKWLRGGQVMMNNKQKTSLSGSECRTVNQ